MNILVNPIYQFLLNFFRSFVVNAINLIYHKQSTKKGDNNDFETKPTGGKAFQYLGIDKQDMFWF